MRERAAEAAGHGAGGRVGLVHLITNGFITGQVLAVDGGVMLRIMNRSSAPVSANFVVVGARTNTGCGVSPFHVARPPR